MSQVDKILRPAFQNGLEGQFDSIPEMEEDLGRIFNTDVWGFREIVLVIGVAMLLEKTYRATRDFYSCNPRPLYEGPIRSVFMEFGIPHRKSGPLNIAKATRAINDDWASNRRPFTAAQATVNIVRRLERMRRHEIANFVTLLSARFLEEADEVKRLAVEAHPESDPVTLSHFIQTLVDNAPDAGNTLQKIIGFLLLAYHEVHKTNIHVVGQEDRASATTTTSKKAGDIAEVSDQGPMTVYEVTTKFFGPDRAMDAYTGIRAFDKTNGVQTAEILVLCRKENVHPDASGGTGMHLGSIEYQDITFRFIDLYGWSMSQLLRMSPEARLEFYRLLNEYISDANTAMELKSQWKALHK